MPYPRRAFLEHLGLGVASVVLPFPRNSFLKEKISFGMVADAHQDIMHDAAQRLEPFIEKSIAYNVDFNIQLGDFCEPKSQNKAFLNLWRNFKGEKHNVLGNHDMDSATKEGTMDFWEMPDKYYSFDKKGFHFVILDANYLNLEGQYVDYSKANFYIDNSHRTFVDPEQIEWLKADLEATRLPTLIFSHQGLAHDIWGVKNRMQIQLLLEEANRKAGFQKVIACFNGHNHVDFHRTINGIHYVEINSLSYQWLGDKYQCFTRYPTSLYDQYPQLAKLAPYEKPLYAFVSIHPEGKLVIEGVQGQWLGPSPQELGLPKGFYGIDYTPNISNRQITF